MAGGPVEDKPYVVVATPKGKTLKSTSFLICLINTSANSPLSVFSVVGQGILRKPDEQNQQQQYHQQQQQAKDQLDGSVHLDQRKYGLNIRS